MNKNFSGIGEGIRNSALIKNPVLFEAIGIAPVVAMAVSVKTAIMLSAISTVEFMLIESITCLALKKLKRSFRVLVYALLGVLINIPLFLFFNKFAPNETANVSVFLPLIAVNSMIALHCERIAVRNNIIDTLVDAVSASVGYVFIVLLVGTLREVIGSGTFYGNAFNLPVKLSGLTLPFGGFLILGFLAAFFKRIIRKKYPEENPELAFNLSEINDTQIENISSFITDEHNPFDDMFASGELENSGMDLSEFGSDAEEEKPKKEKKHKEKKVKEKKEHSSIRRKESKPEQPETEEAPVAEEKPKKKAGERAAYTSEFDDILTELENIKKEPEQVIEDTEELKEKYEISDESDDASSQDTEQEEENEL